MNRLLEKFGQLLLIFLFTFSAEASSLDDLLQQVKVDGQKEQEIHKQREMDFLNDKNQQEQLLSNSLELVKQAKLLQKKLDETHNENQELLDNLNAQLNKKSESLGEVFGVVRQVSGDLNEQLKHSIISAQYPERLSMLDNIQGEKALPKIEQLKQLWYLLQHEMTQNGKIIRYKGNVTDVEGKEIQGDIVRIGAFNSLNDGKFLSYSPSIGALVVLAKQPGKSNTALAKAFTTVADKRQMMNMVVDPTRGEILKLFLNKPTLKDRVKQAGIVGYIIILLGIFGMLIAVWRVIVLTKISSKVKKQQKNPEKITLDNPLGRILAINNASISDHSDALEAKLEEAILIEVPQLDKGIGFIKLLAAVAPLLGLLGTVTGMIDTFQTIVDLGNSDPQSMAGGISQALLTTVFGLIVAVPLLFCHSFVQTKSRRLILLLSQQSAGLLAKNIESAYTAEAQ